MLRNILVLALLVLAPSFSFAGEIICSATGDVTMKQYTDCLLEQYGEDSLVNDGSVSGADKSGKIPFADEYAPPMGSNSTIAQLIPICTIIIYPEPAGMYFKNWCARPGYQRQATREKWHFEIGGVRLVEQKHFHCNVPAEYAVMPQIVQRTVCPPI